MVLPLYYTLNKDGEKYLSATYTTLSNNFPDSIDVMTKMSDLSYAYKDLATQYYTYKNAGNDSSAAQLLVDNPTLDTMILNAAKINRFNDIALSLEWFFKDDVETYLEARFAYIGEYDSGTTYVKGNVISLNGEGFICRVSSSAGVSPIAHTTTTNWAIISQQGIQGVSGTGLAPRGNWNGSTNYYVNDCVANNNILWQCLVANSNSEPTNSNINWSSLLNLSAIVCSSTQPTSQSTGSVWLQIL